VYPWNDENRIFFSLVRGVASSESMASLSEVPFQNGRWCEQRKSIAENEHRHHGFEIALKV
jgi:hypothetical protein